MGVRRAAAFLLLLGACAGGAQAQQPGGGAVPTAPQMGDCYVAGRVVYAATFKMAESVRVRLTQFNVPIEETYTDSSGRFSFGGLSQRDYDVEIQVDGYLPARAPADLSFNCRSEHLTLMLTPVRAAERQSSGGPVSAQELLIPAKARQAYEKGFRELHEKNHPRGSVKHFQQALKLYADYDQAYVQLGLAHFQQEQFDQARRVLDDALARNEENTRAFVLLGMVHDRQGRTGDALDTLRAAIRLDDADWLGHYQLGRILIRLGAVDSAYTHAQRAHELNADEPVVHLLLHDVCMRRRDRRAALAELDEFVARFPAHALIPQVLRQGEKLRQAQVSSPQD